MHKVVQKNMSSSIPHKSEITIKQETSRLFFSDEKFLNTPLPTAPSYPYLEVNSISLKHPEKIKSAKNFK